jgi:hypothetical protein
VVTGDQHANEIASSIGRFAKAVADVSRQRHSAKQFSAAWTTEEIEQRAGEAPCSYVKFQSPVLNRDGYR